MKIKTTVTQERELDIQLPFFRRDKNSTCLKLFAVINEKTVISVFDGAGRTSVYVDAFESSTYDIADKYQNWQPITEQQFLMAHSEALKSLSLEPQLIQ